MITGAPGRPWCRRSFLSSWIGRIPAPHSAEAAFRRIRFLRSSSAPLAPSLHREFLDKFPLLLDSSHGLQRGRQRLLQSAAAGSKTRSDLRGLPWGFETRIIDREGADVPQGQSGEMLIRGAGLMQGYYKQPEDTAAMVDGDGWLHTGDLAYQDEGGYFFVVGRSKELIIKGGVNIAPRQIDDVIESHPAVLEAAAIGVADHYLGEDLVAFVVLRGGASCEESELLTFCESRLGHFKTPTRIYFTEDLPKGPSGKVQRLRLKDEAAQFLTTTSSGSKAAAHTNGHGAPAGFQPDAPLEQIIAESWAEVLCQSRVEADANFFALGGHSLLAVQCVSRLREKIPVALSLSDFFEHATVAAQAELVRKRLQNSGGPAAATPGSGGTPEAMEHVSSSVTPSKITPRDRTMPCPLSPSQRRLWFMEQLNPGIPVYNESEGVRLKGKLHVDALERALNLIIARHDILRATIQLSDNEPEMVIHESWPIQIKQIDLSGLANAQREAEVERLLTEEPRLPYRLDVEPGIRATLLQMGVDDHVLILMMHHIICDWSSEGVLWRELSNLYRMIISGENPTLPPLSTQHEDYAAFLAQENTEANFADDLAFWERNLRGAPQLLELPADRSRPPVQTHRGARLRLELDSTLTDALREFSKRAQTTLFTVFAAALNTLLYRYSGQEDLLLGIPIADRDRLELQQVIGFLLHTQVLRTKLTGDMSFRQLLASVQKAALDLYLHRAVPFDQVVRKLQPERNLSYAPLFQVMLNWRDRDQMLSFIGLEGLTIESVLAESRTSKFDLTLFATDCDDEIWLEMEYSTDLFDEDRIRRMLAHLRVILESVAGEPAQTLSQIPLLSSAEKRELKEWNETDVRYPLDRSLQEFIEDQVQRTPGAPAVKYEEVTLSYAEFNQRANRLAHYLRKHYQVGPDSVVAVFTERSLEMVVALHGVVKAGGAYLPLDPEHPAARLATMLEDAAPKVVLTQRALEKYLPETNVPVIALDADWEIIATESAESPEKITSPADLAYVIYTSGSTGKPKGVGNVHSGIVNRLLWMQDAYPLGASDRVLQKTPYTFDVSVWEFFWPLMTGACLVVAQPGRHRDASHLAKMIHREAITTLHFVPSMLQLFLEEPEASECRSIKRVIVSGEALSVPLQDRFFQILDTELHNLYGPTEAAVDVTYWACEKEESRSSVPIGRPIANTQIHILDRSMNPVPVGIPGELHIGGVGLARGYLNNPKLSAEKFVPSPWGGADGARLYKTGDLARYWPDGAIEYLGRIDTQVKLRGLRIELGEIETALGQHPGVQQVVVVVREDSPGDRRLVAYLVPSGAAAIEPSALRDLLKKTLPDYMVPAAFVELPALPLTPSGKVDRKALPAPRNSGSAEVAAAAPPHNEIEQKIALIWQDVLGVPQVGRDSNFFDLGGHSLLLARANMRLRQVFEREITMVDMFRFTTVRTLATHLTGNGDSSVADLHQATDGVRTGVLRRNRLLRRQFANELLKESR